VPISTLGTLDGPQGGGAPAGAASAASTHLSNQAVRQAIRQIHTDPAKRRRSVVIAISRKRKRAAHRR